MEQPQEEQPIIGAIMCRKCHVADAVRSADEAKRVAEAHACIPNPLPDMDPALRAKLVQALATAEFDYGC